MRLKGFNIGKSKEKPKDAAETEGTTIEQIVEMEEKINGRTKNLEETAQQLLELSDEGVTPVEDAHVLARPHGPVAELSIEPEDTMSDIDDLDAGADVFEAGGEGIKVVEVSAGTPPPPKEEKEVKLEDFSDSINNLFSDEEEEENPLANLIKSMPDVTTGELMDDLNEIKGIIKEWQKS
ncbi:MAG TPA: hypothetical protein VMW86_02500 [Dehalococcoidales bacterium]|nr:hypothetical protein [Dehalococcoidales bacterium]